MNDRELCLILTHDKRKSAWRWVRNQDGVRYVLYKGSIWLVVRSSSVFGAWELGRIAYIS